MKSIMSVILFGLVLTFFTVSANPVEDEYIRKKTRSVDSSLNDVKAIRSDATSEEISQTPHEVQKRSLDVWSCLKQAGMNLLGKLMSGEKLSLTTIIGTVMPQFIPSTGASEKTKSEPISGLGKKQLPGDKDESFSSSEGSSSGESGEVTTKRPQDVGTASKDGGINKKYWW